MQSALREVVKDDMSVICTYSAEDGETSQSRHDAKVTEHKNNAEVALSVKWEDITDFKPSSVLLTDIVRTIHQYPGNSDESYSMKSDSQKSRHDKISVSDPTFVEAVPGPIFTPFFSIIEFPGTDLTDFDVPVASFEYTYLVLVHC